MTAITMNCEPTRIVTVKGGKQEHFRRLVWNCGKLRMRVDVVVREDLTITQSWVFFSGNTLLSSGAKLPLAAVAAALYNEYPQTPVKATSTAAEWLASAERDAFDYSRAGRAWAKAKQARAAG